jgi:hypothetical protein
MESCSGRNGRVYYWPDRHDDDDVQHKPFEWPSEKREREAEEAAAATLAAYPPYVPLEPKKPRTWPWSRWRRPTVSEVVWLIVASPVYLLLGIGVAAVAGAVLWGFGYMVWILFSVMFLGAGGCSMQGGTC